MEEAELGLEELELEELDELDELSELELDDLELEL